MGWRILGNKLGHSGKWAGGVVLVDWKFDGVHALCVKPSTSVAVLKWDFLVGQAGEGDVEVSPLSL